MISPRSAPRSPVMGLASSSTSQTANSWFRPPAPLPALAPRPGLVEFLKAVRHCWALAAGAALGAALLTGVTVWALVPQSSLQYQATAIVNTELKPPVVLKAEAWNTNDYPSYRRTQIDLLKSRAILAPAVRRPEVAQYLSNHGRDPEQVIRSLITNLKVDFGVPDWPSQVLRLTLAGENADETVLLVGAIQKTFLEKTTQDDRAALMTRLASLTRSYESARRDLDGKRQRFLTAAAESGPVSPEEEQVAAMQLAEYQKEMSRLELAKVRARARSRTHVALKPPAVTPEMLDRWVNKDGMIGDLNKRIDALKEEMQKIRAIAVQPESLEEYRELSGLLRVAQEALERRKSEMRPKVEQRLQQIARDSISDMDDDNGPDEASLVREAGLLAQQITLQAQKVRDLSDRRRHFELAQSEQLQNARTEIDSGETGVRAMKEKIDALELEKNAAPRVHGVGDVAAEPLNENDLWRRMRAGGLAALLSGAFTLVGFGWWEFQRERVHSADDVAGRLGIRVVGTLPTAYRRQLPWTKRRRPVAAEPDAQARRNDSVDSVATLVTHELEATGARVLLITSAVEHEGKTTLASDLAASFARNGCKTLLIDSDLVRPSLHQRFGFPLVPGLSEALWQQTAPEAGIRALPMPNLFLLSAGQADPRVTTALGRDAMEPLLKHYRDEFDMIVIDSSPVLPLAHAMRISKHVDAALLAIRNNQSVIPAVSAAYQKLLALHVHVLGAVFIGDSLGHGVYAKRERSNWLSEQPTSLQMPEFPLQRSATQSLA